MSIEDDRERYKKQDQVNRLQANLKRIAKLRERAAAHSNVCQALSSNYNPRDVGVKNKKWSFWSRDDKARGREDRKEIVLTDEEKDAFAAWLKIQASDLNKKADELEQKIAAGGVDV